MLFDPHPSPFAALRQDLLALKACIAAMRLIDEVKYSDAQPRWPEGHPLGGQWKPKEAGEEEDIGDGFGIAPDGALIEPVAECTGISAHALRRMQERGISFDMITDALTNPLKIVPQANGNTLYIGARARVVLSPKGWMVTCM